MGNTEDEAKWFANFDRLGLTLVRDTINRDRFGREEEHQAAFAMGEPTRSQARIP